MDFEELLNQGRTPGDDGIPGDIWDQISSAYTDAVTVRDAAYGEQATALSEAQALVTSLQAHNYRLMMELEGTAVSDEGGNSDGDDGENNLPDGDEVDSIWTVKEDD